MYAASAVDALGFIYFADTIFVIGDGIDRTYFFTGTFQMNDGIIRTGTGAHSAFLTFGRVDMHADITGVDSVEFTACLTSLSETETAVIRN